jgi:antitoxin component of RelBE/YafQ-DinJ toxin-antitoxin module
LVNACQKLSIHPESSHIPNTETIQAIEEAHSGKGFKTENVDDLFKQLES